MVRLLGRDIQTRYLTYLTYSDCKILPNIQPNSLFFNSSKVISNDGATFSSIAKEVDSNKMIYLSRGLILPWPWNKERLITNLSYIGEGRLRGTWNQDFYNHNVKLWLPLGIAWVSGGNHSIATGIIQGEGKIKPRHTYDISEVYQYVKCDGLYYMRIDNNQIIAPVSNVEFAAIFEIGRLMKNNSISF